MVNKQKMNIGWSRCNVYSDYGIIRCYNCNKYGHIQKDCTDQLTCAKYSGNHDVKNCKLLSNCSKCVNFIASNKKYNMNLGTNHTVWDILNCETYKRIEKKLEKINSICQ